MLVKKKKAGSWVLQQMKQKRLEKHSDTQILAVSGSEIHAFKWKSIGDIRLMNEFSRYVDANDLPFSSSLLCDCFGIKESLYREEKQECI